MFYGYQLHLTFFVSFIYAFVVESQNVEINLYWEKNVLLFLHSIYDEHNNTNPVAKCWGVSAAKRLFGS